MSDAGFFGSDRRVARGPSLAERASAPAVARGFTVLGESGELAAWARGCVPAR